MARTSAALPLLLVAFLLPMTSHAHGDSGGAADDHDATPEGEAQMKAFFEGLNGNGTEESMQGALEIGSSTTELSYYTKISSCESGDAMYTLNIKGVWAMRADASCEKLVATIPQSVKFEDADGYVDMTTYFGEDCSVPNFKLSAEKGEWTRLRLGQCASVEVAGVSAGYLLKRVDVSLKDGGARSSVGACAFVSLLASAVVSVMAFGA